MSGDAQDTIDRARIAATERRIRPYIRVTPVIEVDAADFGLDGSVRLTFKLELLQHAGSFILACVACRRVCVPQRTGRTRPGYRATHRDEWDAELADGTLCRLA